jgi:hypothetical protein
VTGAPPGGATATGSAPGAGSTAGVAPGTKPIEVGFIATKCSNCSLLGSGYVQPTYSPQQLEQAMVNGINASGGIDKASSLVG